MAVTAVDVDESVLAQAKAADGVRTNKEAIDLALRDAVMRTAQLEAIDAIAGMQFDAHPEHSASGA